MLNIHEAHMEIFGGDHILGIFGRKKNRECSRKKKLREGENYLEEKIKEWRCLTSFKQHLNYSLNVNLDDEPHLKGHGWIGVFTNSRAPLIDIIVPLNFLSSYSFLQTILQQK